MTPQEMRSILSDVRCGGFAFRVHETADVVVYLQVGRIEEDAFTEVLKEQRGRKWLLSAHMTRSELVQTALMAVLAYMEHETRESFTYKGERIFGPHFDVEALVGLTQQKPLDYRL